MLLKSKFKVKQILKLGIACLRPKKAELRKVNKQFFQGGLNGVNSLAKRGEKTVMIRRYRNICIQKEQHFEFTSISGNVQIFW